MKWDISPSTVISLGLVVGAFALYSKFKAAFATDATAQAFADKNPNLAALAISLGFKTPTGHLPDTTGAAGATAEQTAFNAVVNDNSQGFYNAALAQYAHDNGFDTSLAAQGSTGWPWKSYADWANADYPALPTAGSVSVDSHGVYHNTFE